MLFRSTWTRQPQQPVDVDRNGLGKGVQMLLTQVGGKVVDVANPSVIWTPNGNAKTKAAPKGVVATFDGVDDYFSATGYSHIVGARGTFFIWLPRVGAFDTYGTVWFGTNTGAASFFQSTSLTAVCFGSGSFATGTVTSIANSTNTSLVFSANTTVNTQRYFRNGISEGTLDASTPTAFAPGSKTFNFGRYVAGTTWDADADILIAGFTTEVWGAAQAKAFHDNPWQLFAPTSRKIWVPAIAGGGYTLTAASGSYALSGQAATITKTRIVSAGQGSYSYSGQSATILKTRIVAAAQGSYSYTGQAATVLKSNVISAAAGSYAYAGQAASILKGWVLTAANGSYSVTGQAATINYTPAAGSYVLNAAAGSYALTGQSATILKSKVVAASAGAYSLAGVDATITYSGAANTGGGSYDEPRPKRRRHIIEVDGRLLEFGSKAAAIRYLDNIKPDIADKPDDTPDDIQPVVSNKPKKPLPAPKLDIPLAQIEVSAPNTKALEQFKAQLRALEYQAILKAYEDWQDEQDIEILLMAM